MIDWYENMFKHFKGNEQVCDSLFRIAQADENVDKVQMAYITDMYVIYRNMEDIKNV